MDGKIIRFYPNTKPREIVDDLASEDLLAAGFGPYRYKGTKDLKTGKFTTVENSKYYVHSSVPRGESIMDCKANDYPHPVIQYELSFGWEAKFGAIRYSLRNQKELQGFMKTFNYQLPNDQ